MVKNAPCGEDRGVGNGHSNCRPGYAGTHAFSRLLKNTHLICGSRGRGLEPLNSLKKTDFFNTLLGFDFFNPAENILNGLFDAGDAFLLGFYEAVGPVDDVHGVEGEYYFGQPSRIHIRPDFSLLFCPFD